MSDLLKKIENDISRLSAQERAFLADRLMRTVTIPEDEYLQIQQNISELKREAEQMQYVDFAKKLALTYHLLCSKKVFVKENTSISLKRGSGKEIITYMAEDFDEPLEDFMEYME